MYKSGIIYIAFKIKKTQINTKLCCHTGVCLLKVLLNLPSMYRYSSGTTTLPSESLVQTLSSKREKIQ